MAAHKHYERVICLCCFLIFFCNIGLPSTSFNVFQPYLAALPFVGDGGGSIVLGVRTFTSLVAMFCVARYVEALGARRGAALASLLVFIGFVLYAVARSMACLIAGAVFAGAGYGLGGMVIVALVTRRWFSSSVGTALGIAAMGSGVASFLLPPAVARIIEATSLSWGFAFEAGVSLVCGALIFGLLRDRPADLGLTPYINAKDAARLAEQQAAADEAARTSASASASAPAADLNAAARTASVGPTAPMGPGADAHGKAQERTLPKGVLAVMIVGAILMACPTIGGYNYFAILFTGEGMDTVTAALLVSILGISLTTGKFISGLVMDRIGTMRATIILYALMLSGLLFAVFHTASPVFPYLAVILFGMGATVGSVGVSMWAMELAGPGQLTRTVRNLQVAYAAGGFLYSLVPGFLAELTGSYIPSYEILVVLTATSAIIVVTVLRKYAHKVA